MIDLYFIACPIYALFILLTLISLKFAILNIFNKEKHLRKNHQKLLTKQCSQPNSQNKKMQEEVTCFKKGWEVFIFLLKQFTFLQIFMGRKSQRKLPLFMGIAVISIWEYYIKLWPYISSAFGGALCMSLFIVEIVSVHLNKKQEKAKKLDQMHQFQILEASSSEDKLKRKVSAINVINLLLGILTVGIFLYLTGIIYKNYKNAFLQQFMISSITNIGIDLFLVRPTLFLLFAFTFGFSEKVQFYLQSERIIEELKQALKKSQNAAQQTHPNIFNQIQLEFQHKSSVLRKSKDGVRFQRKKLAPVDKNKTVKQFLENVQEGSCENILNTHEPNAIKSINNFNQLVQSLSLPSRTQNPTQHQTQKKKQPLPINQNQIQHIDSLKLIQKQKNCIHLRKVKEECSMKSPEIKQAQMKDHWSGRIHNQYYQKQKRQQKNDAAFEEKTKIKILKKFYEEPSIFFEESMEETHQDLQRQLKCAENQKILKNKAIKKIILSEQSQDSNLENQEVSIEKKSGLLSKRSKQLSASKNQRKNSHAKSNFLKINEDNLELGDVEEIDLQNIYKRSKRPFNESNTINEEVPLKKYMKKHRRRATKYQNSEVNINGERMTDFAKKNKNKSQLDLDLNKTNHQRKFYNKSKKRGRERTGEKPIVHENSENLPAEFYIPNF